MTASVCRQHAAIFREKVQKGHPSPLEGAIVHRYCVLAIGGFFGLNWIYQVIRKPGELFAPISASLSKSPETTWQSYGSLFRETFYQHYFT